MSPLKIALDVMGGDHAPRVNIKGAVEAYKKWGYSIVLVGNRDQILRELERNKIKPKLFEIVHAEEVIDMHEHASTARRKKNSSMNVAFDLMREKKVDAVVSPGHTGAFMAGALFTVGRLPGVSRPALTASIPSLKGEAVMLDIGANVDCKPKHLVQFALMGDMYCRLVKGVEKPRVGLLSNGTESSKGNDVLRTTDQELKTKNLNYIGFVEPRDVFRNAVDVVVCDGFYGNLFLKTAESILSTLIFLFKKELKRSILSKLTFLLFMLSARKTLKMLRRRFDYAEHGAAPLLGINGLGFVCHGSSSAHAIRNALHMAALSAQSGFLRELNEEIARLGYEKGEEL